MLRIMGLYSKENVKNVIVGSLIMIKKDKELS